MIKNQVTENSKLSLKTMKQNQESDHDQNEYITEIEVIKKEPNKLCS